MTKPEKYRSILSAVGNTTKPLLIAGPCSAETEEQVHTTAKQLAVIKEVSVLRAGLWKPRTRPNSFEGVGEVGIDWLVNAGKEHNFRTTTEVANARHAELALKKGVDILWIGARTTVNPFSVQDIADAIKGANVPVLIKNPINPDIQLWMGAIERIAQSGNENIIAIHRGFASFEKGVYRNAPMWEIPIELRSEFPDIPVVCDPSHIAGKRKWLKDVSQKALDLDMAGLMIEVHTDPDNAWSDKDQQITPQALGEMMNQLTIRRSKTNDPEFIDQLSELRKAIDEIDDKILRQLAERIRLIEKIGSYKKDNNVTTLQLSRWREILSTRRDWAKELNLNDEFIKHFLEVIHQESIRIQSKQFGEE